MNTQDWYNAMEHNRKLAEKRGENVEFSQMVKVHCPKDERRRNQRKNPFLL